MQNAIAHLKSFLFCALVSSVAVAQDAEPPPEATLSPVIQQALGHPLLSVGELLCLDEEGYRRLSDFDSVRVRKARSYLQRAGLEEASQELNRSYVLKGFQVLRLYRKGIRTWDHYLGEDEKELQEELMLNPALEKAFQLERRLARFRKKYQQEPSVGASLLGEQLAELAPYLSPKIHATLTTSALYHWGLPVRSLSHLTCLSASTLTTLTGVGVVSVDWILNVLTPAGYRLGSHELNRSMILTDQEVLLLHLAGIQNWDECAQYEDDDLQELLDLDETRRSDFARERALYGQPNPRLRQKLLEEQRDQYVSQFTQAASQLEGLVRQFAHPRDKNEALLSLQSAQQSMKEAVTQIRSVELICQNLLFKDAEDPSTP